MTFLSQTLPALRRVASTQPPGLRAISHGLLIGFASLLTAIGLIGTLLPGHLGLPVLVIGLIILLRNSRPARRRFIGLQRRHPKLVFPIRRLLRREPEVMPVAWQQVLRLERMILPRQWRPARAIRRRFRGA
jgi:hypothetical protein